MLAPLVLATSDHLGASYEFSSLHTLFLNGENHPFSGAPVRADLIIPNKAMINALIICYRRLVEKSSNIDKHDLVSAIQQERKYLTKFGLFNKSMQNDASSLRNSQRRSVALNLCFAFSLICIVLLLIRFYQNFTQLNPILRSKNLSDIQQTKALQKENFYIFLAFTIVQFVVNLTSPPLFALFKDKDAQTESELINMQANELIKKHSKFFQEAFRYFGAIELTLNATEEQSQSEGRQNMTPRNV